MFGRSNKGKSNNDRCQRCGHFLVAPGQAWTARFGAQSLRGSSAQNLTQVPAAQTTRMPPPPTIRAARPKSLTRTRLEQGAVLGCCGTVVLFVLFSPLPAPVKSFSLITSSAFLLSVALGKENQDGLFKLVSSFLSFLDRNKDGAVDVDDLRDTIDDMRERFDDALNKSAMPIHEPPPDIKLTTSEGTRPIAGAERPIARSLIIRSGTIDQPALVVELDILCAFIRSAVGLGVWTRKFWTSNERGDHKLSPDTWQAYQNFFNRNDVSLWKIYPPTPDLPGIIGDFRQWATDQPATDRPTEANGA